MFGGNVTSGSAFIASVSDKLPAVGTVAMQGDQQFVSFLGLKFGWQELHEALFGLIDIGQKEDIFGLR